MNRKRNLENFRAAVMDGAISAIITTLDGNIEDWNRAAERIFHYSPDEAIGQSLAKLLGFDVEAEATLLRLAAEREHLDTYPERYLLECTLHAKDGSTLDAELGVRPFQANGDEVLIVFIRDVSRRVAAERSQRITLAKLLHAEQEQRAQVAEELHDDTIQVMAATLLRLDTCETRLKQLHQRIGDDVDEDFAEYEAMLTSSITTLREALRRTRRMMFELRPPDLETTGLAMAVRVLAREIGREAHFTVVVNVHIDQQTVEVEKLAYRVVMEALTNIRKHARATRVTIAMDEHDGDLHGSITDDGTGFDVAHALESDEGHLHLGLSSCRERVGLAGGYFFIASEPTKGTNITFSIPSNYEGITAHTRRVVAHYSE